MDEKTYQAWSETLSSIRGKRHASLENFHQEKGADYTSEDFVNLAMESIEDAISKWWSFETQSRGKGGVTEDATAVGDEMTSVVDFELDAITRDLDSFEGGAGWDAADVAKDMERLAIFSEQLKQNYSLKIRAAFAGPAVPEPKTVPDQRAAAPSAGFNPLPAPPISSSTPSRRSQNAAPRTSGGTGSRGSGVAMFLMFILGLLLGSGPSFYFWDMSQKVQSTGDDQIGRLASDKRALEDNLGIYQHNLAQLATGKIKTLPQLEAAMEPIREDIAARKRKIEREFYSKRESLLRRTQDGDLRDRAIGVLERNRDEALAGLEAEEKTRLEPYLKKAQILKELTEQR